MNSEEVLATLRKLGKPQTAAIYRRHGSGEQVFGVLTSEIARLQKKIKVNHPLAMDLWKSGNAEARTGAPGRRPGEADPVRRGRPAPGRSGPLHRLLFIRAPGPQPDRGGDDARMDEAAGRVPPRDGLRNPRSPDSVSDADAEGVLETIEKEIHRSANWARYAMNGALISIGVCKPALRRKAIEAARRIGKVEVDHGETCCRTPDAIACIETASKRKRCP
jgi:hypothetical protein